MQQLRVVQEVKQASAGELMARRGLGEIRICLMVFLRVVSTEAEMHVCFKMIQLLCSNVSAS